MHMFQLLMACATLAFCGSLMVNRSIKPNVAVVQHIAPAVQSASTTLTTNGVDLQGFDSAMAIVNVGAIAGVGVMNVAMWESDLNTSDYTAVAAADMDSDIATSGTLIANTVYRLGYKGKKRYIGVILTLVSGTSVAVGVNIAKGRPSESPV